MPPLRIPQVETGVIGFWRVNIVQRPALLAAAVGDLLNLIALDELTPVIGRVTRWTGPLTRTGHCSTAVRSASWCSIRRPDPRQLGGRPRASPSPPRPS